MLSYDFVERFVTRAYRSPDNAVKRIRSHYDGSVRQPLQPPNDMWNELIEPVEVTPGKTRAALGWMRVAFDQARTEIVRSLDDRRACPVGQLEIEARPAGKAIGRDELAVDNVEHAPILGHPGFGKKEGSFLTQAACWQNVSPDAAE
ncbi:MAG: hypothetical protein IPM64_16990 [Phycisphaerales bacterium]|nr:hypothetical protein [Phycisphaerales bacterium]